MVDNSELRGNSEKEWLNPPLKEKVIEYFKENHPNITATFEEMLNWYYKNLATRPGKEYDWTAHQKRDQERARKELQKRKQQP